MKDQNILMIGRSVFWVFFLLGNICLFGYLITNHVEFALAGYLLLMFGSIINILMIIGLLIYGFLNKSKLNSCYRSTGIILINIPIAILYAVIGINII